jgi:hypothetical protein
MAGDGINDAPALATAENTATSNGPTDLKTIASLTNILGGKRGLTLEQLGVDLYRGFRHLVPRIPIVGKFPNIRPQILEVLK